MPNNYWYVTFITNTPLSNGYCVTIFTDVACHLWLRDTPKPPWKHPMPVTFRGLITMDETRFCFVAYTQIEQIQAGDTTVHTFQVPFLDPPQSVWYYLVGTINGSNSPSTSPIVFMNVEQPISFENLSFMFWPTTPTAPEPWVKFTAGTGWSDWTQGLQYQFKPNYCCLLEAGGYSRMTGFRQFQDATPYRNQTLKFIAQGYGVADPNTRLRVSADGTGAFSTSHAIDVTNVWQERSIICTIPANSTTITIEVTVYSPGYGPRYTRWTQIRVNTP